MELKLNIKDNFDLTILYTAINIAQSISRHNLSKNNTTCADIEKVWSGETSDEFTRLTDIKTQIKDILNNEPIISSKKQKKSNHIPNDTELLAIFHTKLKELGKIPTVKELGLPTNTFGYRFGGYKKFLKSINASKYVNKKNIYMDANDTINNRIKKKFNKKSD